MLRVAVASFLVLALLSGCADNQASNRSAGLDGVTLPAPITLEFAGAGTVTGSGGSTTPANPHGCTVLERSGMDVNHHLWEIPESIDGMPVTVSDLSVILHIVDLTLLDADLFVEGPNGAVLGAATAFNVQTGPDETVTVAGDLQAGTYHFIVRGCAGQGKYTVTATATAAFVAPDVAAAST